MPVRLLTTTAVLAAMTLASCSVGALTALGANPKPHASVVSVKVVTLVGSRAPKSMGLKVLVAGRMTVVAATTDLAVVVRVRNEGKNKSRVPITLQISQTVNGGQIVKSPLVETSAPVATRKEQAVRFDRLGELMFASESKLTVTVDGGKSVSYPVIFTLP